MKEYWSSSLLSNKIYKLIFVIDDAHWHNILIRKMLKDSGYDVMTFTNGYSLLESLKEKRPHLIISDIDMSGLNGIELHGKIKNMPACENIPVIYVSSLRKDQIARRDKKGYVIDYLQKPLLKKKFFLEVVAQKMRTHLDHF